MANVKLNPILERIRGQVGDLVFRRFQGRTILSRKPDLAGVVPSEAQLAHKERFRQAALYGKVVMADAAQKSLYVEAAKERGKPVFSLTVADYLNPPVVTGVDLSGYAGVVGDAITIAAVDDFEVSGVQVQLSDGDGSELEAGSALRGQDGFWVYTATTAVAPGTTVRVVVTAIDRPGGTGEATADKVL